jgi:hypothetical protein
VDLRVADGIVAAKQKAGASGERQVKKINLTRKQYDATGLEVRKKIVPAAIGSSNRTEYTIHLLSLSLCLSLFQIEQIARIF